VSAGPPGALEVTGLSVTYGKRRALDRVSLTVEPGEIVALLGANGAGKSTTLRAISGLVRPSGGTIRWDGRELGALSADAIVTAGIGHVPEGREVFVEFTVHENLLVGGHTVPSVEVRARLEAVYRQFPVLRERRRQRAGTLSGGEQQMLVIARALMSRPRLLLLDEPSLGLAPRVVQEIFRIIRATNIAGVGVLLVEQNARAALTLAARAYILGTGQLVASGPAGQLLADASIQSAYLGKYQ
jgi:branched-chain amino acid transport system ATP-binding protein